MKIKCLYDDVQLPTKGSDEAAGYDLYAYIISDGYPDSVMIVPHQTVYIHTGLAMEIPKGMFGGIYARSGLATKKGLRPANCTGVIDSDYRGEVMVALHNDSKATQYVQHGERIAQLIIQKYVYIEMEVVDELSDTKRGDGGFGSTGLK